MNDEEHNGWTNRATWNVSLWLGNDKAVYEQVRALKLFDAAQFANFCGWLWGNETPDGDSLQEVNWEEIAEFWGNK